MKKYFLPLGVLGIFMTIAVTLWLTQDNIFYLLNFSYIGWCIWALFAVKICRLRDFGIIFLQGYSKLQQFIMRWQKFLDHCFLAEVGVGMPVGRQWCLIFFRIKFPKHHGKRLGG